MVALAPNTSETSSWDILDRFPKLHSRAREVKTGICTEAPHSKSLSRVEIWQAISESCIRLESFTRDPIGYEGSAWGLYEYVDGMPLTLNDPTGLKGEASCEEKLYSCVQAAKDEREECVKNEPVFACDLSFAQRVLNCKEGKGGYKECTDKRRQPPKKPPKGPKKPKPPKGPGIVNKVCGKIFSKFNLVQCEADCVSDYDGCLDRALETYEGCMSNSHNPQWLCDRIYNLDITACPASYAACGLSCLLPF